MAEYLSKCDQLLKLLPHLQCHKCKDVPGPNDNQRNRYYCIDQSHTLCEEHKAECPCESKVGKVPSPIIAELLKTLPWMCKNYAKGCREIKINADDLEHHQKKQCVFDLNLRSVFCPYVHCGNRKVLFKDVIEHINTVHRKIPEIKMIDGKANRWNLGYQPYDSNTFNNGLCWYPSKITTTDGDVFYDGAYYVNKYMHMWIYYYGSSDEAKNFSCSWSFVSKSGHKFYHSGIVHTFDKNEEDIFASGSFFALPISAFESSFITGEKPIELTIRNLKKEAKGEKPIELTMRNLKKEAKDDYI